MRMRTYILAAAGLLLLGTLSARSQESSDNGVLPFLGLATDARTAGLAGAGSTLGDNTAALYGNAASALTGERKAGIGLFTGPWTGDFQSSEVLLGASGYYNIGGKNGILAGFRRIAGPDIELTDEQGLPAGTTRSCEWTLDLGYGHLFAERWAVAVTAHYVRSDLGFDDPSNGVMFGLHAAYKGSFRRADTGRWSVGLSLLDFGPELKVSGARYPLPMRLRLGGSVDRRSELPAAAEGGFRRFARCRVHLSAARRRAGRLLPLVGHERLRQLRCGRLRGTDRLGPDRFRLPFRRRRAQSAQPYDPPFGRRAFLIEPNFIFRSPDSSGGFFLSS